MTLRVVAGAPRDGEGLAGCTENQEEQGQVREEVVQCEHGQSRISCNANEEMVMNVCSILKNLYNSRGRKRRDPRAF